MKIFTWFLVFYFNLFLIHSNASFAISLEQKAPRCGTLFTEQESIVNFNKTNIPTYNKLIEQVESKKLPLPEFYDHTMDKNVLDHWKEGAAAPKILIDLLPKNISYLAHSVLQPNEPGVVKQSSGSFITVRAAVQYKNQMEYTNVGIVADALFKNKGKSEAERLLVPSDAKGIIVYRHGGGTIGTGHHVATQLAAFFKPFGIYVVSYDHANHALGPRALTNEFEKTSAKADVDFGYELIKQHLAKSGVPIFLSGHSMGGVYSLAEMIMFDQVFKDKKVAQLIKGFIPLSPVLESAPYADPTAAMNVGGTNADIPPAELASIQSFILNGKIQPLCEMGCSPLTYAMNLQKIIESRHKNSSASQIPALIIVGTGDFLYAPFKEAWNTLETKSNIEVYKMGKRINLLSRSLSQPEDVGHLILDFIPPIRVRDDQIQGSRNNKEISRIVDAITLGYPFTGQDVMTLYRENIIPLTLLNQLIKNSGYYDEQKQMDPSRRKQISLSTLITQVIPKSKPMEMSEWRKNIFNYLRDTNKLEVSFLIKNAGDIKTPEPFLVMKEFIEKSLNKQLIKEKNDSEGIMPLILTEWMRNLVFRAFVENYTDVKKTSSSVVSNLSLLNEANSSLSSALTKGINFNFINSVNSNFKNWSTTQKLPPRQDIESILNHLKRLSLLMSEFKKTYHNWETMEGSKSHIFNFTETSKVLFNLMGSMNNKIDFAIEELQNLIGSGGQPHLQTLAQLIAHLDFIIENKDKLSQMGLSMGKVISQVYRGSYLPENKSQHSQYFQQIISEQDALGQANKKVRTTRNEFITKQAQLKSELKKMSALLKEGVNPESNAQLRLELDQLSAMEQQYLSYSDEMSRDLKIYLNNHHKGNGEFEVDIYRDLPQELREKFKNFRNMFAELKRKQQSINELIFDLIQSDKLFFALTINDKTTFTSKDIVGRINEIESELNQLQLNFKNNEMQFAKNTQRISEIELEKLKILGEDSYLNYETVSLMPILNGNLQSETTAVEIWKYWLDNIWGNRITESALAD